MLTHAVLLAQLLAVGGPPTLATTSYRPRIEVWTNRGEDPYSSGEAVRVSFKTERDAFVTLLRVDTDGRIHILFPREPWGDNFASGGRVYEVEGVGRSSAFGIDDYPGEGYIFAIASADPFTYDGIASAQHWDYRLIGDDGQIRGDPYAALTDLASRMLPENYPDWDYDVVPYYVQQHYQYPRFLCYDCHSYVSYPRWNPYDYSCVRFRIVVFDDPYYYPYRYYGGRRVAFTRPYRPEPRFIFKDRGANDAFVTRVRERPVNDDRRRDVGVRGRDLGGPGFVPAPRESRRAAPPSQPSPPERRPAPPPRQERPQPPDQPSQRERPAHPDHPAPRTAPASPRQAPKAEPQHQGGRESGNGQEPELRRRRP
ncbi:MAG TPA: DUF4384 domain-containing protein [Gemmatimonadales bacterium]|nr:DUF4384 domain-containing protein [Gemmatimonadales bacterium]